MLGKYNCSSSFSPLDHDARKRHPSHVGKTIATGSRAENVSRTKKILLYLGSQNLHHDLYHFLFKLETFQTEQDTLLSKLDVCEIKMYVFRIRTNVFQIELETL